MHLEDKFPPKQVETRLSRIQIQTNMPSRLSLKIKSTLKRQCLQLIGLLMDALSACHSKLTTLSLYGTSILARKCLNSMLQHITLGASARHFSTVLTRTTFRYQVIKLSFCRYLLGTRLLSANLSVIKSTTRKQLQQKVRRNVRETQANAVLTCSARSSTKTKDSSC